MKLGERSAPRPYPFAPPATTATVPSWRTPTGVAAVVLAAALVAIGRFRPTPGSASPPLTHPAATSPVTPARVTAPPAAIPAEVRYPMSALLGIDMTVDIDGSRAHLLGLFPAARSQRVADELRYEVLLDHRWFSEVELNWKNERAGKVVGIAFRPPTGDDKFKNQKEIADCLAKGLGKPELHEADHLSGEVTYAWNARFPKATAALYSSYLWLDLEDPKGVPPITFPQVVRTLNGCELKPP